MPHQPSECDHNPPGSEVTAWRRRRSLPGYNRRKSHPNTRRPEAVAASSTPDRSLEASKAVQQVPRYTPIQSVTQAWPHLRYLPQAFCAVSCLAPGRTPRGAIGAARSLASNTVRSRAIWLERNPRHSHEECLWVRTQSQGQSLGEYCTSHRRTVLYKRLAGRHRASARSRLCCSRWHRQSESYSRLL